MPKSDHFDPKMGQKPRIMSRNGHFLKISENTKEAPKLPYPKGLGEIPRRVQAKNTHPPPPFWSLLGAKKKGSTPFSLKASF